ncbi:uncharacterized protein LOC143605589 [Bidens hawaiensis]|uniref:uncharacterized protein LOC143605589 n=1 Tax=Bidens hawaiensis TaxID=980011 RepID=UPI00404B39BB
MWQHMSQFVDLTDEEFSLTCLGCESESGDEDDRNGVYRWILDESFATDSGMILKGRDEKEEEGSTVGTLKRKGMCSCDEKDTTNDQLDATVKRQRPCSCSTAPPAAVADEQRDVAAPV